MRGREITRHLTPPSDQTRVAGPLGRRAAGPHAQARRHPATRAPRPRGTAVAERQAVADAESPPAAPAHAPCASSSRAAPQRPQPACTASRSPAAPLSPWDSNSHAGGATPHGERLREHCANGAARERGASDVPGGERDGARERAAAHVGMSAVSTDAVTRLTRARRGSYRKCRHSCHADMASVVTPT